MNPLFEAGFEFQDFMKEKNWPFCFIGGLAVIRWGEMRMTQDIDLCLKSGFGNEEMYVNELLARFETRITGAFDFALTNRVLLLSASNGVSVDVSLSGLPFEKQMIERASLFSQSSFFLHFAICISRSIAPLTPFAMSAAWAAIFEAITPSRTSSIVGSLKCSAGVT